MSAQNKRPEHVKEINKARRAYPMRVPACPVAFETVNRVRSWSAADEMGVYCGQ